MNDDEVIKLIKASPIASEFADISSKLIKLLDYIKINRDVIIIHSYEALYNYYEGLLDEGLAHFAGLGYEADNETLSNILRKWK